MRDGEQPTVIPDSDNATRENPSNIPPEPGDGDIDMLSDHNVWGSALVVRPSFRDFDAVYVFLRRILVCSIYL